MLRIVELTYEFRKRQLLNDIGEEENSMLCAAIVRSGLLHERISHSASSLILYHLSTDFTCLCHFKEKKIGFHVFIAYQWVHM